MSRVHQMMDLFLVNKLRNIEYRVCSQTTYFRHAHTHAHCKRYTHAHTARGTHTHTQRHKNGTLYKYTPTNTL